MNILLVIPSLNIGGAEVTVVNLANNLAKLGHNVYLFECYYNRNNELVNTLEGKVKIVSFFKMNAFSNTLNKIVNRLFSSFLQEDKIYNVLQAKKFKSVLKKYQIEVVNSHLPSADYFIYMTLGKDELSSVKWVVSMHGSYENNSGVNKLANIIFKYVDGIIYLTERNLKVLGGYSKEIQNKIKYVKIYNSLGDWQLNKAVENYPISLESDLFTFGLISRADYRKGWAEAIETVIKLNENHHKCRLILAGDGPDLKRMQKKYSSYEFIIFMGFVKNPLQLIQHFDIGLLPSYFESLPYTIIEYIKSGKPVVATRVGEVENMILKENANCGKLVDVTAEGVDLENLYSAMKSYAVDDQLYKSHSANALLNYKKFDPDNWGMKVIKFYQSL